MAVPLFQPFRALGYITDDIPFAVQRLGREAFVTVSAGKAWQVYNCSQLRLSLVGPQLPHTIQALASKGELVFAAVKGDIIACKRMHREGVYSGHTGTILQLLCMGDHLLSLGSDSKLLLWKIGDFDKPQVSMDLGDGFSPACMAHPDTYLNKVLVGGAKGRMQLWNFSKGVRLFEFTVADSDVKCIVSSPALDVVGVGLADGRALLHNIRFDEPVASFANASGTGTNDEAFLGAGVPLMAAGGGAGAITVWDLEKRRLHTIIRDAHDAPITTLHFFPGEPRLMSAGADNAIKQWVFDAIDGTARLLRFRSGHAAPPTCLKYYGEAGTRLLSAGQDRAFRMFSVIQDQQSSELSQGHIASRAKRLKVDQQELKLPRVTALDACQLRERDWCNVISAHEGDTAAYTWRLSHLSLGEHVLRPRRKRERGADAAPDAPVTAVAISCCGNFGLVGTAAGRVDRYNMQSGLHRGSYNRHAANIIAILFNAHEGAVVGVAADACNKLLVTGGLDGRLRIWAFKGRQMRDEIALGSPPTHLCHHANSALLSVACDDLVIRMYDVEAVRSVRQFKGHTDRITDLHMSADARWLLSASLDGTVRAWDVPSSMCLQASTPVTALSLSPAMDMLATAHVNRRGIYLWSNSAIYGSGADIRPSNKPVDARLPALSADEEMEEAGPSGRVSVVDASGAPVPLHPALVTLALLPRSQWQGLVHLDAIKERNRPTEPPTKPAAAPFFLPTIPGLEGNPVFDTEADADQNIEEDDSLQGLNATPPVSDLARLLLEGRRAKDYTPLLSYLRGLSPSKLDGELRAMQVRALPHFEPGSKEELQDLCRLLDFLTVELAANRNYEFMQALLRLTLQVHGEAIVQETKLRKRAVKLEEIVRNQWGRMDDLFQTTRSTLSFLGNLQT
ncbi:WD40 repeat-like protein [Coccomyxa subellipsoidea C-169]|uniref:WD40 repeat-like protein n=1 Tax=Coccomyxa subellipsoidea (strain C-169) TaxID=574566 RepID=I0YU81_COCSC|nr:WD40 repeat-like protein [Coccomyxa subellipsoidea C-169]EIE21950.1 WD40 repeat-like protein [Coccomyxa subellipsoidea C-169]|eukprot:XP_005646494.1 WD40 repeat-like protein [Coccomyxa subellipsoidea C-169]